MLLGNPHKTKIPLRIIPKNPTTRIGRVVKPPEKYSDISALIALSVRMGNEGASVPTSYGRIPRLSAVMTVLTGMTLWNLRLLKSRRMELGSWSRSLKEQMQLATSGHMPIRPRAMELDSPSC